MAAPPSGIITLLTDFGLHDGYVACMKGVILGIAPRARLVDITHDVAPQNIAEGSYLLQSSYRYFPAGSVHVVVVDPGVGSDRRPIAVSTPDAFFVGPDNGVLGSVVAEAHERWGNAVQMIELTERRYWLPEPSATFHGRDVFAPVAGHLAAGMSFTQLGAPIGALMQSATISPDWTGEGTLEGRVAHIDRFGNCMTNISAEDLAKFGPGDRLIVEVAGRRVVGLARTYSDVAEGLPVALVGSNGRLEVAVRNGNAARVLGLDLGDTVRVMSAVEE